MRTSSRFVMALVAEVRWLILLFDSAGRVPTAVPAAEQSANSGRRVSAALKFPEWPPILERRETLCSMAQETLDTHRKALTINLDPVKYGTLAEIGAGQEVARWFFRVGGASGTIAKAMSAYDMIFSDAIYGQSDRYVS